MPFKPVPPHAQVDYEDKNLTDSPARSSGHKTAGVPVKTVHLNMDDGNPFLPANYLYCSKLKTSTYVPSTTLPKEYVRA